MYTQILTKIIFSTLTTGIITMFLPQPTLADSYEANTVNPLQDLQTVDNPDPFTGSGGLNMFDIIHNSRLGNNRDMNEYMNEQRDSLNDAATQFRNKQQQLLQQPENAADDTPTSTTGNSEVNPQN